MSFCYINGSYKNNIDALISVEDRGFNFSDGIYEVMGFRNGKLLNFERHLKTRKTMEKILLKKILMI